MDLWDLYTRCGDGASRAALTREQRQFLAVCDLRQEVNAGGFDSHLRRWGADTASEALALLPRALGEEWHRVLSDALAVLGTAATADADERAAVLDAAAGADDVLERADERFLALEAGQDADVRLGLLADELSPWPTGGNAGSPSL